MAQAQLARALGRDSAAEFVLRGRVPTSDPDPNLKLEQLVYETPDHRRSAAEESASRYALGAARAPFYPALDLSGSLGTGESDFFPDEGRWQVGVSLCFLFQRRPGLLRGQERQLLPRRGHGQPPGRRPADSDQAAPGAERFSRGGGTGTGRRGYLDAALVRAEIARNKYNNGLLSFEDWDIIENDLITRQKTVIYEPAGPGRSPRRHGSRRRERGDSVKKEVAVRDSRRRRSSPAPAFIVRLRGKRKPAETVRYREVR